MAEFFLYYLKLSIQFLVCINIIFPALLVESADFDTKATKLSGHISDGVIHFRDRTYREFVKHAPRNYHLFLFYTVADGEFGCTVCSEVDPEFKLLADSYGMGKPSGKLPLFFGVVDYSKNGKAFDLHGFTSVPHLAYFPPEENDYDEDGATKIDIPEENLYTIYQRGRKAEDFCRFIEQRSGIKIEVYRSPLPLILAALSLLLTAASIIRLIISNLERTIAKFRNWRLWMFVSLMAYALSISGMVYCVINNSPAYHQERSGKLVYFSSHGDDQYVAEGLIIALYNIFIATSTIALTLSVHVHDTNHRVIALVASVIFFGIGYLLLFRAYIFKNPWYAHRRWYDS